MWETPYGAEARDAARRAGLSLFGIPLESPIQEAEYRRAFTAAAAGDVAGLIMPDIEEHVTYRRLNGRGNADAHDTLVSPIC